MKPTSVPRHQNVQTNNLQCLNSLRTWQDIPEHELSSLGRRRKKCMSEVRKFKPLTHRDPLMRSNLLLFQLTYHHTSTQLSKTHGHAPELTQPSFQQTEIALGTDQSTEAGIRATPRCPAGVPRGNPRQQLQKSLQAPYRRHSSPGPGQKSPQQS